MVAPPPDRRSLQLVLIDEDPVFRSGLRIWLEQFSDIAIIAEAEDGNIALQVLASYLTSDSLSPASASATDRTTHIDLVILDIGLGRGDRSQIQGFDLCRQIKAQYPTVPILLLSAFPEPILLAAAQRVGANGYCARGLKPNDLLAVIRRVANGQSYWMDISSWEGGIKSQEPGIRSQESGIEAQRSSARNSALAQSPIRRNITRLRRNLRLSGIQQIDAALFDVNAQLQSLDLSDLDRAVLAGRQRELRVSRWLVNRLLATREVEPQGSPQRTEARNQERGARQRLETGVENRLETGETPTQPFPVTAQTPNTSPQSLVLRTQTTSALANPRELQSILLDAISAKLQTGLGNGMETAMETDILREDKKRELFYLVLRKLEDLLGELRYSQVEPDQLQAKRSLMLLDLWQAVVIDFFGKYSTIEVNGFEVEIVDELLQDMAIVQSAILDKIPGVVDLLQHLLFQIPLGVDGTAYPPGNPESLARAEMLLENLMIQVANAVMQPLLNRFADVENIKQSLYDRRLLSNREIERFRNDLSWQYRLTKYVHDPTDIFESKYSLYVLSGRGIKKTVIYASRAQELQQLSGIPLIVTVALETRDAVAPRLRSVVSFVGNGLIYVLTEVVGRGIGLIGRGVIKGIGNVWQDGRFNRR